MAGLLSGSQSGCRHATRRSDRRKTTVKQVNVWEWKRREGNYLQIERVLKKRIQGEITL